MTDPIGQALGTLGEHITSERGKAALRTITEESASADHRGKQTVNKASAGRRSAADSARSAGNSPFEQRQLRARARTQATARKGT